MSKRIDADLVRHIGKLSRIELTEEEVAVFARQFGDVLEAFGKLQQLDTTNVQPMAHAVELFNVLADDVPHASLTPEEALANAPDRAGNFFRVTRVIGGGA